MSVRTIDISANSFSGVSGKTYIVYPSLSTERFRVFETMQLELEYKTSVSGLRVELDRIYKAVNDVKFADAAVMLNNILNGAARIEAGEPHPILLMCALFICPETEQQGRWSEAEAREKIDDWADIDISFFLGCARRLFRRFIPDSGTDSLNTSETEAVGDDRGR